MDDKFKELKKIAIEVRKDAIDMVYYAQSGHPGGSLSAADILTVLYFNTLNIDPNNPKWPDRDRFVMSKGHASPGLYAVLSRKGFFSRDEFKYFRQAKGILQGHPDMKKVPGVDMSTGSLGQGISTAVGMAIAGKIDKKDYRVYSIIGDGESQEGQVWEALMAAAHYKLDNLTAFLDHNGLEIDGKIVDVMSPEPFDEKFRAFGWHVIVIDGHDIEQIINAIEEAKKTKGKPTMIIANTVKGKYVSFMENDPSWHGSAPNDEQYKKAMEDLDAKLAELEGNK